MQNLFEDLKKLLARDERFTAEGELLKNKIVESALKLDENLIKLLLSNREFKEHFFTKVGEVTIFDKDKFVKFVSNKQFLPDSYTAFKNKIGLTGGEEYISEKKDVVLSWPYKDCVLEGGQTKEDSKRDEIFWNQTLAPDEIDRLLDPKVFTNAKRVDKDGEHGFDKFNRREDGTISDNLIIKGNNLLALHSLKKEFAGKVKLIYIDPPFNTGNDSFKYNDRFNHSTWLTFMKNRLEVAKDLLKEDGFIFIQINDIEQGPLKVLCDEVFGRENFHTTICVQMSYLSGVKMAHKDIKLPKIKEFILFYNKSSNYKLNPQYVPANWEEALERYTSFIKKNGYSDDDCENWKVITVNQAIKEAGIDKNDTTEILNFKLRNADKIFRTARNRSADYSHLPQDKFSKITNEDGSYHFVYKGEDVAFAAEKVMEIEGEITPVVSLGDVWTDIGINNLSNEGGVDLRFGKKPERLIERLIKLSTQEEDLEKEIILDFFAGSGTTGAVAHKLGMQYILIEQLQDHIQKSQERLENVIDGEQSGVSKGNNWQGGGDYVYLELTKWNQEFIEKVNDTKSKKELEKIWKEMQKRAFLSWRLDFDKLEKNAKEFNDLSLESQKKFLLEVLDQNQLYINYSEIEDEMYRVSKEDKKLNKEFYEN